MMLTAEKDLFELPQKEIQWVAMMVQRIKYSYQT